MATCQDVPIAYVHWYTYSILSDEMAYLLFA